MNQIVQIVSEVETQLFIHSDGSRFFLTQYSKEEEKTYKEGGKRKTLFKGRRKEQD